MKIISHTVSGDSITVITDDGKTHEVRRGQANFEALLEGLRAGDQVRALNNLTQAKTIETWSNGLFKIAGGKVLHGERELPAELAARIRRFIAEARDPQILLNFWNRLRLNPSFRSVQQVYKFVAHENIPITKDGFLLTYKAVRPSFKDFHTGTVDNRVGVYNSMDRNLISDDPNEPCHYGFHVGALPYVEAFGNDDRKIVICKVDPKDIVCVPYDHSHHKVRVCAYEVVGHYGAALPSTTYTHEDCFSKDLEEEILRDTSDKKPDVSKSSKSSKSSKKALKKAGSKLAKKQAKRAARKAEKAARKATEFKRRFDRMSEEKLLQQPIDQLRQYAAKDLSIYGASKILGGRLALVAKILEVRGE